MGKFGEVVHDETPVDEFSGYGAPAECEGNEQRCEGYVEDCECLKRLCSAPC